MDRPPVRFAFAFAAAYRPPALAFGITPRTAWVEVDRDRLRARFGLWSLATSRDNVTGTTETGDFAYLKTAGPAHLSFSDRGVTFATNAARGLCIQFREPVNVLLPGRLLGHPAVTVTVADVPGLAQLLEAP